MKAISDSTDLISLSKIGFLDFLKELFEEIIIPKEVYNETIILGRISGKSDILSIERLIEQKFITIKEPKSIIEIESLDKGEKECISLCKELDIDTILIDETEGFNISEMLNLLPIRTTSILTIFLDNKIINLDKYKISLKKIIENGYFLDALTYERLLEIGKNIAKK